MIFTLTVTILIESFVALAYCSWRHKPLFSILITNLCENIITQSLLWAFLRLLFGHYLAALLIAEIGIWILEGLGLYAVPANRLTMGEALSLSLAMNLSSAAIGWWLPV